MTGSEPSRSPAQDADRAQRIRMLNDQFRATLLGGKVMLTTGISDAAGDNLGLLLFQVRQFDNFQISNDPYDEHDFGAFEWNGDTAFWKIDYYDGDLVMGSPDPADPVVTTRVLTIMLAWEY